MKVEIMRSGFDPSAPRVDDMTLPPYDKPCWCGAAVGATCVRASEYTPLVLDRSVDPPKTDGGERRPTGLYFARKPHIRRGA